ncbi:MAG: hypothetical protein P8X69_02660, partial [Maritimibacter sp.]
MLAAYLSSARPTILYRKQRIASLVALPAVIATLWACPQAAPAQYWTGGGGNTNWHDAANWSAGVPTSSGTAFLGTVGIPATTAINSDAVSADLVVGFLADADLTVTGVSFDTSTVSVGSYATGRLTLEAGANFTATRFSIGEYSTGEGTVIATG